MLILILFLITITLKIQIMRRIIAYAVLLLVFCSPLYSQNQVLNADMGEADATSAQDIDALNSSYAEKNQQVSGTEKVLWCASGNTLVTGYPAWTHSWAGWMVNIKNISTNTITINCFEARFSGTSGYRIYTKTGTFVGFETTSAAWTLVGTAANVTGISTTTSSPIPIAVNVNINPGATRAFYLTRTDNTNRHNYVAGTGTAGTTVYSSDANLQLIEGNYIDVYFILMGGPRRPSMQVYYSIFNPLPIELHNFNCKSFQKKVELNWSTSTEKDNAYFAIERSADGINFDEIGRVEGAGTSTSAKNYSFTDNLPTRGVNYYRLKQIDFNEMAKTYEPITCLFEPKTVKINVYSTTGIYLTSVVTDDYKTALDNSDLLQGMYLLEFPENENTSFVKFFKK